jgi:2,3-bisphosphoglycerate-dependent phosphoglycerate mutase
MGQLILLRHGQSQWNLENRFTGWTDVPLSEQGEQDAIASGKALKGRTFDAAFTSVLTRAIDTLSIVLETMGHGPLPITRDAALNERHYGDLQGLNKAETAQKFGEEQVKLWRRSYSTRPPGGESLEDCYNRVIPYLEAHILPLVHAGKSVIVTAHGNSLKPMFKYFDGLSDDATAVMEVGLCLPYIYTFEGEKMTKKEVLEVPGIVAKGTADIHQKA